MHALSLSQTNTHTHTHTHTHKHTQGQDANLAVDDLSQLKPDTEHQHCNTFTL